MSKVAIIDYNCGNIFSLANALNTIKQPFDIVDTASSLAKYDHAILPGVGSFGPAMRHLIDIGFDDELREFASKKKNVLGICLGMQLLLSESHENGLHNGIGLIDGVVEKITVIDGKERVPNIGWHTINNNSLSQIPYKFFDGQNVFGRRKSYWEVQQRFWTSGTKTKWSRRSPLPLLCLRSLSNLIAILC